MTPDELLASARRPEQWPHLASALAPLTEKQRAALVPAADDVVAFRHQDRQFDPGAQAIVAVGVLTDLDRIAVYGFGFAQPPRRAEPFVLQALRDRNPRWVGRLGKTLLMNKHGSWRATWMLVNAGMVPTPTSDRFLTRAWFDAEDVRREPELLEAVVWPQLTTAGCGRRWVWPDIRPLDDVLLDQVALGRVDRDQLIDTLLAALLIGLPPSDQRWHLQMHAALDVTDEEVLARLTSYGQLHGSENGAAVTLAQQRLTRLADGGRLPVAALLDASRALLPAGKKSAVVAQLALLRRADLTDDVRAVVALAADHPNRDVAEAAAALAGRAPARAQGRSAPPLVRPAPAPVVPVRDVDELVSLGLAPARGPIDVDRLAEGCVRLGKLLTDGAYQALPTGLFRSLVRAAREQVVHQLSDRQLGREVWTADGFQGYQPLCRLHELTLLWDQDRYRAAAHDRGLLSMPSTDDGTITLADLLSRIEARPRARARPYEVAVTALRLETSARYETGALRRSDAGSAVADQVVRLVDHVPSWTRSTLREVWRDLPTVVWTDPGATAGSQTDPIAAVLGSNQVGGPEQTARWSTVLHHRPELLAAHGLTSLAHALGPETAYDQQRSGVAELLAGLGASRHRTGPVVCTALGYGLAATSIRDRTSAVDAVVELATYGLLDGAELANQTGHLIVEGAVKGTRVAASLAEAARGLDALAGPVLDTLVGLLPAVAGRSDAHRFLDATAETALTLGRTVRLPSSLQGLKGSSALARAIRRVPM